MKLESNFVLRPDLEWKLILAALDDTIANFDEGDGTLAMLRAKEDLLIESLDPNDPNYLKKHEGICGYFSLLELELVRREFASAMGPLLDIVHGDMQRRAVLYLGAVA